MKTLISKIVLAATLPVVVVCTSGCFTTTCVWRERPCRPAEEPHIRLAVSDQTQDVLVQYDERFDDSKKFQSRAYWLVPYQTALTNFSAKSSQEIFDPKKAQSDAAWRAVCPLAKDHSASPRPVFVKSATCTNLSVVPQVGSKQDLSTNGYCALASQDKHSFTVWHNGALMGTYDLPVYCRHPSATAGRIALTVVTVISDAAIDTLLIGGLLVAHGGQG